MGSKNSKDRVRSRRLEALDRRREDISTLEGGKIPGMEDTPFPGDLHISTVSRIIEEKLVIANADVKNLLHKLT